VEKDGKGVFMKKVGLLALLLMFALSGTAMAKDSCFGGGGQCPGKVNMGIPGGKWWKKPQVADKIVLTLEEKKKLDTMYLQHQRLMIDLKSQVEKEQLELEHLLDSSTFTAAACMGRFKNCRRLTPISPLKDLDSWFKCANCWGPNAFSNSRPNSDTTG